MPRKNQNANFAANRAQKAKEDRAAWLERSAYYTSYEAKLDEMLDQAEADNEDIRRITGIYA